MKRSAYAVLLTALLIVNSQDAVFAANKTVKPKTAGRTASSIPNTILNGTNAPKSTLGIDGDFYIDTKNQVLYGPKTSGKWPTGVSLKGVDGTSGKDGKTITNASTVAGPQGPQGEKGEKGDQGERGLTGDAGPAGPAGASGPAGPAGATGPAGPSGATGGQGPAGTNGTNGTNGSPGTAGATGATGATGAKGDTGTAGISLTTYGELPVKVIQGGAGAADTYTSLGNLTGGAFYVVHLTIWSTSGQTALTGYGVTFTPSVSAGASLLNYTWNSGLNKVNRSGSTYNETAVNATLFISTTATSSFSFSIRFASSTSGTYDAQTLNGTYEISQVGEIKAV